MNIRGDQIRFSLNGDYVNCETSCELNVVTESIGKSSSLTGSWRYSRDGYKSWSMTVDAHAVLSSFAGSFNSMLSQIILGGYVNVEMSVVLDNEKILSISGEARVTNFNLSAGTGNASSNVTFEGNGELKTNFELFWQIINAMPANSDKPNIIDTNF